MGEHSRDVTAVLTANEPPNGTVLVVATSGEWRTIKRDDGLAYAAYRSDPGRHVWFDLGELDSEPMELHTYLKYADAVYALGEKLAEFP